MAFLRKRESGNYSLSFKWKGKSYIKALGTDDEQAASEIKHNTRHWTFCRPLQAIAP